MEFEGHREPLTALNRKLPESGCSIVKAEPTAIAHEPIPAPQPAGICPSGFLTPSHILSVIQIQDSSFSPRFRDATRVTNRLQGPLPPVFFRHSCPQQTFLFLDFKSSHGTGLYMPLVFLKAQHSRAGISQRHPQVKQTDLGRVGICGGHSFRAGLTK